VSIRLRSGLSEFDHKSCGMETVTAVGCDTVDGVAVGVVGEVGVVGVEEGADLVAVPGHCCGCGWLGVWVYGEEGWREGGKAKKRRRRY